MTADLLHRILDVASFCGARALSAQVSHISIVAGGLPHITDIRMDRARVGSCLIQDGPIPGRVLVLDNGDSAIGELLVWVQDGYLSALEYAWFTDEPPVDLPCPDMIRVVGDV